MSQPEEPPVNGGRKRKSKIEVERKRKMKTGEGVKIRVKLPPIESYQRELEFKAEGPGRVVVRLERLMGTDRVRLTDSKFMSLLLEKLEEEERIAWVQRNKQRKKSEKNRSRQLAISGLMEPAEDMQDLYEHPVFRVNRILKKLAQMDQALSIGQILNLPPIIQVEPFDNDHNGRIFKTYPRHYNIKAEDMLFEPYYDESESNTIIENEVIGPSEFSKVAFKQVQDAMDREDEEEGDGGPLVVDDMTVVISVEPPTEDGEVDKQEDENEDEEEDEEEEMPQSKTPSTTPSKKVISAMLSNGKENSLTELQKAYGIPPTEDLLKYEPFRSTLVDLLYADDEETFTQLYQAAEEIIGVYERENITVDEFVIKLGRMLGGAGGGGGMST